MKLNDEFPNFAELHTRSTLNTNFMNFMRPEFLFFSMI